MLQKKNKNKNKTPKKTKTKTKKTKKRDTSYSALLRKLSVGNMFFSWVHIILLRFQKSQLHFENKNMDLDEN